MRPRGGMTLVEVLIATLLLVGGLGTLLFGMYYAMIHAEYIKQAQVAMNAAQSQLEQLAASDFNTLTTDGGYCMAGAVCIPPTGARPVSQTVQGVTYTYVIQIRPVPLTDTTPDLLDIHVAACWQHRGRAIGEANGLTPCADRTTDGDWWVDSPIAASTRVARKQ